MTLSRRVRRLQPRIVIEIGTYLGGTLFCWPKIAARDAVVISVDLPGGPFGPGCDEQAKQKFETSLLPGQRLVCVRGDSASPATLGQVRAHLDGRQADFLFIDGDHAYDAVRGDYERYAPLVRPGGLIALHDIVRDRNVPGSQVHRLWKELRQTADVEAILDDDSVDGAGMGIGLVRR